MGAQEPDSHPHPPRGLRRVMLPGLAGVLALVLVGVVVLVATSGAKKAPTPPDGPTGPVALVDATLSGIPQHANTLGSLAAPVTLEYFGDLECPFCREFTVEALPSIIARFVRTGKLKIIYRSLQTATKQRSVFLTQQSAALAAAPQNKMWFYVELFYHEQGEEDSGYVTEQYLEHLAEQVPGLNLTQWMSDRNKPIFARVIAHDNKVARGAGATGTPSLFFGKTGGQLTLYRSRSLSDPAIFEKVIEQLLSPRSPS